MSQYVGEMTRSSDTDLTRHATLGLPLLNSCMSSSSSPIGPVTHAKRVDGGEASKLAGTQ
jgi:hypothetical protein